MGHNGSVHLEDALTVSATHARFSVEGYEFFKVRLVFLACCFLVLHFFSASKLAPVTKACLRKLYSVEQPRPNGIA